MLCSCGAQGKHYFVRREMPYCDACLEHLIVGEIRRELRDQHASIQEEEGYFLDAVRYACKKAQREIRYSPKGARPGCLEIAAAAHIKFLLGISTEQETVFPTSVTFEEMQTFFKPHKPVELDSITQELISFDKAYPGTTRSILRSKQARRG